MSSPDSTVPLSSVLRSSPMKSSDMPQPLLDEKFGRSFTCGIAGRKPGPGSGNRDFKCDPSRLAPRPARRHWAATGRFFLPLRLDRRDPVAGVALVDVHERAQSDPGQLSDPDRANAATLAARRQADL